MSWIFSHNIRNGERANCGSIWVRLHEMMAQREPVFIIWSLNVSLFTCTMYTQSSYDVLLCISDLHMDNQVVLSVSGLKYDNLHYDWLDIVLIIVIDVNNHLEVLILLLIWKLFEIFYYSSCLFFANCHQSSFIQWYTYVNCWETTTNRVKCNARGKCLFTYVIELAHSWISNRV